MTGSERSLLFYEDRLDLGHLKISLEKYELNSIFTNKSSDFLDEAGKKKYDLLILSGIDTVDNNLSLIDSLYITINSDTPVLLIIDSNNFPPVDDMLKQELNIITFPFTPQELIFRAFSILKTVETNYNIHKSLKSYKNLLDIIPVGIIQTDAHGKFIHTNPDFQALIEMEEKDLIKENFFQLCHPDDYFLERKQLDRLLRKELKSVDFEIRLINNEGETKVCAVEASTLWKGKDIFDSFAFVIRLIP